MFTGIIEEIGSIEEAQREGQSLKLGVKASFLEELRVDESISHNGICLTVCNIANGVFYVTAIEETLNKTNQPGTAQTRKQDQPGKKP